MKKIFFILICLFFTASALQSQGIADQDVSYRLTLQKGKAYFYNPLSNTFSIATKDHFIEANAFVYTVGSNSRITIEKITIVKKISETEKIKTISEDDSNSKSSESIAKSLDDRKTEKVEPAYPEKVEEKTTPVDEKISEPNENEQELNPDENETVDGSEEIITGETEISLAASIPKEDIQSFLIKGVVTFTPEQLFSQKKPKMYLALSQILRKLTLQLATLPNNNDDGNIFSKYVGVQIIPKSSLTDPHNGSELSMAIDREIRKDFKAKLNYRDSNQTSQYETIYNNLFGIFSAGEFDTVVRVIETMGVDMDTVPELEYFKITSLLNAGRWQKALESVLLFSTDDPELSLNSEFVQAIILYNLGKHSEAKLIIDRILTVPNSWEYWTVARFYAGFIYRDLNLTRQAANFWKIVEAQKEGDMFIINQAKKLRYDLYY